MDCMTLATAWIRVSLVSTRSRVLKGCVKDLTKLRKHSFTGIDPQ